MPFAESARLTAMIFTLSGWLATAGFSISVANSSTLQGAPVIPASR
jgi:hypothetical protein